MDVTEFIRFELQASERQLRACLADLPEPAWEARCTPDGMTIREMVVHLAEAYRAAETVTKGGKHSWGQFDIPDRSADNLIRTLFSMRQEAIDAIFADPTDDNLRHAHDYLTAHDYYHVGQMVLARLQAEPDWNSEAIYG